MISKAQKQQLVQKIAERLKHSKITVLFDFSNLKAPDQRKLKKDLDFTITKKTLLQRSLKEIGIDFNTQQLAGPVAIAFGNDESVFGAIFRAGKEYKTLKLLGGFMQKEFIDQEKALALGQLPSKQELRAMFVGCLQSVIRGFVAVLDGISKK